MPNFYQIARAKMVNRKPFDEQIKEGQEVDHLLCKGQINITLKAKSMYPSLTMFPNIYYRFTFIKSSDSPKVL